MREGAGVGGVEVDLEVGLVGGGGDGDAGTRGDLGSDGGSVHPEGCLGVARDGHSGVGIGVKDVDAPLRSGAGHHGGGEARGRGGRDPDDAIVILPPAREGCADANELDDLVGGVEVVRANLVDGELACIQRSIGWERQTLVSPVTPEGDHETSPMGLFGLGLTVRAMASGTACQVALTAWEKKRVPDASRRRSWKLTSLKWETARETLVLLVAVELCDVSFRVQATGNCRGSTRGSAIPRNTSVDPPLNGSDVCQEDEEE